MVKGKNIAIIGWIDRSFEFSRILSKNNKLFLVGSFFNNMFIQQSEIRKEGNITFFFEKKGILGANFNFLKRFLLISKKIDLFHVHMVNFALFKYLKPKKPFILTVHGYISLEFLLDNNLNYNLPKFKIYNFLEKMGVQKADAVIAVDTSIEDYLNNKYKQSDKVFCIPNGINPSEFDQFKFNREFIRSSLEIDQKSEHECLITCIRGFYPKNGVFVVLEAINFLVKKYDVKNFKLALGGEGPLKKIMTEYITKENLTSFVVFLDYLPRKQVLEYFFASDIIVNTFSQIPEIQEKKVYSLKEALEKRTPIGTSNTTLEALATGNCTVVCSPEGFFNCIDSENDIGVILPYNDPTQLASVLKMLIENEELRINLGKRGKEYVIENRSWEVLEKELEKIYEFALAKYRK